MNDARREERPRDDISEATVKLSYRLCLPLALGAAGAVGAQQPRRITFNDAIAIALEQNLAVRQAKNATALTAATVQQQEMQLLPDLRLNVNGADNVGRNFSLAAGEDTPARPEQRCQRNAHAENYADLSACPT